MPAASPAIHVYTNRTWGHDFVITEVLQEGRSLCAMGWGRGLKRGDYIILPNEGASTRYQIGLITYFLDPPDMWKAFLIFAPRPDHES